MNEIDIYENFINDETFATLPFIKIEEDGNDVWISWSNISDRLDKLAAKYYGNPSLGKLILMANPFYICETDIEDGDIIRIPFPKSSLFSRIKAKIEELKNF